MDELNALATSNPAEYDRRMAEQFAKEQAEVAEREAKAAKRKRIKVDRAFCCRVPSAAAAPWIIVKPKLAQLQAC